MNVAKLILRAVVIYKIMIHKTYNNILISTMKLHAHFLM